jgi:phage N-6-adenine-methyltransferase
MMTTGMYSSLRADWETPPEVFGPLNDEFHFQIDVCATHETAKCSDYFTPDDDALSRDWAVWDTCWMNPPYGRQIGKWVRKAYESSLDGATVVCLLPARTDTAWWHDYCARGEIRFLRGRVYFWQNGARSTAAPFPSAVVVFRGRCRYDRCVGDSCSRWRLIDDVVAYGCGIGAI